MDSILLIDWDTDRVLYRGLELTVSNDTYDKAHHLCIKADAGQVERMQLRPALDLTTR